MSRALGLGVVLLAFCPLLLAQGRGAGGGGMRQGQGQQRYGQGMGSGAGNTSQVRVQSPQQERYQDCTQATSRLRKTLRNMSRLRAGAALNVEKARRYREQLRQQWQLLMQERTDWLNALSPEQTTEAQAEIASSGNEVQKLKDLVDLMELDLDEETVNTDKVRENAAKAEAVAQKIEQEQQKVEEKVQSAGKGQ